MEQAINELYEKADELYGYHIGDEITVAGEQYYVIADSHAAQDYIVALKKNVLTSMVFGSTNNYDESDVKVYLENWISVNFVNDDLKEINGYKVRLITKDEFNLIPTTYNWRLCNGCWTMTSLPGSLLYEIRTYGLDTRYPHVSKYIRPVINVYKSAIQKTN